MKLNLKYAEGVWYDFDDEVKVKVRMFPNSKALSLNTDKFTDDDLEIIFKNCCIDWQGIEDQDGNVLECNEQNKEIIIDMFMEFVNFVMEKQQEIRDDFENSKKKSVN